MSVLAVRVFEPVLIERLAAFKTAMLVLGVLVIGLM